MTLKLPGGVELPDHLATMKLGIIGRTGSGKTNTAVVLAEHLISSGTPVAIIDPQGDWWGLRSKYSIAILGGENSDFALEPTGGTIAADFVINERVSVLLDLFSMGEAEMVRFATDFAKRLWTKNRDALHVFLDEADLFAPQQCRGGDKAKCLGAWQNVCRRGRSRGIGLTMVTQRSAVINKDLLTQADPMIVHRVTAPQDLNAVDAYLECHGDTKDRRREICGQVARLGVGEGLVLSPGELGIDPVKVKFPKRKSFDSGATPESGKKVRRPKKLADIDLTGLQTRMAESIERTNQADPKFLKNRIAELEKQVRKLEKWTDTKIIDRAIADRDREWKQSLNVVTKERDAALSQLDRIAKVLGKAGVSRSSIKEPERRPAEGQRPARPKAVAARPQTISNDAEWFKPAHQKIIDAIAWLNVFGISQPDKSVVAARAGVSPKSSSFKNNVSRLSANGLVLYPGKGQIELTDNGEGFASTPDEPPTLEAFQTAWLTCPVLKPAHRRLLEILIENYPDPMNKEDLAAAANVSPASSSFKNNVSRLSSIGLVRYPSPGNVVATELIFPPIF